MNKITVGENNSFKALELINDFGWLRAPELGVFIWHKSKLKTALSNAAELISKMKSEGLLIVRKLPKNSGFALMASERGALLLRENGIDAKSGKNIGGMVDGNWSAPTTWEHDLKACGLLARLSRTGYTILAERKIKRENPNLLKIPDGVFYKKGEDAVYWLEVENTRKSGKYMDDMVKSILSVERTYIKVSGLKVNVPIVAFESEVMDEKGYALNHSTRVTNALQRHALADFTINYLALAMRGVGVAGFTLYKKLIEADATNVLFHRIKFSDHGNGESVANINEFRFKIIKIGDKFKWRIKEFSGLDSSRVEQFTNLKRGMSDSFLSAKRECILAYRYATETEDMGMD